MFMMRISILKNKFEIYRRSIFFCFCATILDVNMTFVFVKALGAQRKLEKQALLIDGVNGKAQSTYLTILTKRC